MVMNHCLVLVSASSRVRRLHTVQSCIDEIDITAAQLDILSSVYGEDAVPSIPKMWAMYKEVADYYEQGVSRCVR